MKRQRVNFCDNLMKDEAKTLGKIGCGVIVAAIILIAISLFLNPLLLMLTWNYAICALFPALPLMSYWIAFGVNLFLGIVGGKFKTSITQNFKDYLN